VKSRKWFLFLALISFPAFADINLNYFVTEDSSYLLPILSNENDKLYMEARYNYEDFDTASLFVGRRFRLSDKLDFDIVPMIGGATGNTDGVIPGLEFSVRWGKFWLSSEQEYLIDLNDNNHSFFYVWSDFGYDLFDWLTVGLSLQRLKPFKTSSEVDYGAFLSFQRTQWSFAIYNYVLDEDDSMNILSLNYAF
jgi:hypothetical protein